MISKGKSGFIKSLQLKKYRKQEQSFLVEGATGVLELLQSDFVVTMVCASADFIQKHRSNSAPSIEWVEASQAELEAVGSVESNDAALAVAKIKSPVPPRLSAGEFAIVLDDIRDPGNLGTIIRTADWYGIRHVIASEETADVYNPKVIRSTMGSFCRVNVFYTALTDFLQSSDRPVYGTFLDGKNVHGMTFADGGLVVIGNESHGISPAISQLVSERITIPRFGKAESLNAGIATAIILDNIRRR